MCERHSFILTKAGKVLDGLGLTDSHTDIRELHGLKHTNDQVNAYEWQPPKGWPDADWETGLTKDTEVFVPKSSHLDAIGRHIEALYPTQDAWDAGDATRPLSETALTIARPLLQGTEFVTVPETTLPNGQVVPTFMVSKYLMSIGEGGIAFSADDATPKNNINYHFATAVAERCGYQVIRESQWLALAWNIAQQDINWTGGKVGDGALYQGMSKGTVSGPQRNDHEPKDAAERRWHQLPNGERIFDMAGHLFSWVFDDVQGDERGIVAKRFADDSPSLTAPYPSMEKGMGWRPTSGGDWSGNALFRGGCWYSNARAGVFRLSDDDPGYRYGNVGFRVTKGL